jgi:sulfide:quinone oxidoreductase
MPTTTYSNLKDAGLADSTGYLDVDPYTLQHKKYSNIFGLGDVTNVPTTKSFYGGLSQVGVVRHNVQRHLNGLSLNAKYDGYSTATLSLSSSSLGLVEHTYANK